MKTKLISLTWRGSASVDPRFSAAMLPWAIADICTRESFEKLSVGIENNILESYNSDFELQFTHHLKYIVGMCKMIARHTFNGKCKYADYAIISNNNSKNTKFDDDDHIMEIVGPHHGLIYLLKDPRDPLLHIYLYESDSSEDMTELMYQMRDPAHKHGGSVGSIPSSFVAKSGSNDITLQKALRGQDIHSTPASNLKLSEAMRTAHHDGSPTLVPGARMSSSKSYTNELNNSSGTVQEGTSSSPNSSSLNLVDVSAINSQYFEVMYVGKIKVSHKRVPFTFIDDALPKFKAYDAQKIKFQAEIARRLSNCSVESEIDTQKNGANCETNSQNNSDEETNRQTNQLKIVEKNENQQTEEEEFRQNVLNTKLSEENKENSGPSNRKLLLRGQSQVQLPVKFDQSTSLPLPLPKVVETAELVPKQRDRSASIGSIPLVEQNRTMVFLVGKTDVRLISPDRKEVLLHKNLKEVASCAQGHKNADHFAIICREVNCDGYIGYVFKCQSDSVADDVIIAITQAFVSSSEQKQKELNQIFSCEHCPMLWFHKVCSDVEGLSEKKTQTMIFRRIEQLSDEEQNVVMAKYYGAEEMADHSIGEQNQFLMMLLRAHCESRQQRHVHDTAENRSEFLNQYLGGSTIFMKAKRSLTNSFDHLLKRKNSKDDFGTAREIIVKDSHSINNSRGENLKMDLEKGPNINRPRACSIGSATMARNHAELKSPMMDIFMKVGNNPKDSETTNEPASWRQEMLNRVVTPSKNLVDGSEGAFMSPLHRDSSTKKKPKEKRSKADLRQLWKTAIRQTILLARMEKENARLQACHNENELKKIKLDYEEIIPCDKQALEQWEVLIDKELKIINKRDPKVLLQAIKTGVPRSKRGEVWSYLGEQFSLNTAPIDTKKFPNFNTPYNVLLKSLTEHQHAIFIDLGRTFPNHSYYKAALGVGQLSLFNILKAYSILDPELGYCQGLGFICGVLLLHCDEEQAFNLLKHLMFKRQMRNKYLPDMKEFQLQLYQLSRLVRDHIPDLYEWLDRNDVSPTLYSAPWILTVFSSQFPLGFVTRIFDILFLDSPEVIFKVALALLNFHKDELLERDNFEEIMDYLKNVVPKITPSILDKIMKDIFAMDLKKQLSEYQVEYNVLQEEITATNVHINALKRERENSRHLETQLQFAQSSIAQMEKIQQSQQHQNQALQSQIQGLETTIQILGNYLSQLTEKNHNIEMPGDIRRIVQNICLAETRKKPMFTERKIGKSMSVNAQLGFPLKVLEELNESLEKEPTSIQKPKAHIFDNTYQQMRQQNRLRPSRLEPDLPTPVTVDAIKLPKSVEKALENMTKSPIEADSGIATPLSPLPLIVPITPPPPPPLPPTTITASMAGSTTSAVIMEETDSPVIAPGMHPFSSCEDVNFKFNGTTQLKSLRSSNNYQTKTPSVVQSPTNTDVRNARS